MSDVRFCVSSERIGRHLHVLSFRLSAFEPPSQNVLLEYLFQLIFCFHVNAKVFMITPCESSATYSIVPSRTKPRQAR